VTSMYETFFQAAAFNKALSTWDTSKVVSTVMMFYAANADYNHDFSGWDVAQVTDMTQMFRDTAMDQDLCKTLSLSLSLSLSPSVLRTHFI